MTSVKSEPDVGDHVVVVLTIAANPHHDDAQDLTKDETSSIISNAATTASTNPLLRDRKRKRSTHEVPVIHRMEKRTILAFVDKKDRPLQYLRLSDAPSLEIVFCQSIMATADAKHVNKYPPDILGVDVNDGEKQLLLGIRDERSYQALMRAVAESKCWKEGQKARCRVNVRWHWSYAAQVAGAGASDLRRRK